MANYFNFDIKINYYDSNYYFNNAKAHAIVSFHLNYCCFTDYFNDFLINFNNNFRYIY
jgi:hypothetical protein